MTRLSRLAQELGWLNAGLYLCDRVLRKLSFGHARLIRYQLVAQPIPATERSPLAPSASSTVIPVTPDHALCRAFPRPASVIRERFHNGHRCLAACVKGRFAGFLWWAHRDYEEDEVHCHFVMDDPTRAVWDFDVYVAPEFRLGRTFWRLWAQANRDLAAQGVEWSFSRISAFNATSQVVHGHFGLRPIGTITFLRFGPLQLTVGADESPFKISWNAHGRPTVLLKVPSDRA